MTMAMNVVMTMKAVVVVVAAVMQAMEANARVNVVARNRQSHHERTR
jgi:hypothetical protein